MPTLSKAQSKRDVCFNQCGLLTKNTTGWWLKRTSFSQSWRLEFQDQRASTVGFVVGAPPDTSSRDLRRDSRLFLSVRALTPSSGSNHLPKAPFPRCLRTGGYASAYEFVGGSSLFREEITLFKVGLKFINSQQNGDCPLEWFLPLTTCASKWRKQVLWGTQKQ